MVHFAATAGRPPQDRVSGVTRCDKRPRSRSQLHAQTNLINVGCDTVNQRVFTVDKNGDACAAGAGSILTPTWHGFLQNGELV